MIVVVNSAWNPIANALTDGFSVNIREARKAISKYVHIYNFERCHSALNNQTPASCYYPTLLLDDHAA